MHHGEQLGLPLGNQPAKRWRDFEARYSTSRASRASCFKKLTAAFV